MRGIDWFAGTGGYTSAMREAGIDVVGACEWDAGRRSDYLCLHGAPAWFPTDALEAPAPPAADLWSACASVARLRAWLTRIRPDLRPTWLLLETVRCDWLPLIVDVAPGRVVTLFPAGARGFVIAGPRGLDCGRLPPHDGQGPGSDPVAIRLLCDALREARLTRPAE